MTTRLHRPWWAGLGALILILALGGVALGADSAADGTSGDTDAAAPLVVDTTATFEDVDGDGIDDDCDPAVVADPEAAAAAEAAADLDGDGTISVSEAAQSGRTGGANCNHGGYVSPVAQGQCATSEEPTPTPTATPAAEGPVVETVADEADETACADETTEDALESQDETACVPVAAPTFDPATIGEPGAFGAYVSSVAQSDAIGGKNCNHGGAVSDAVHAAKEAAKAAHDAAKAAAKAEREAAKAEREAERAAAKAAREAQHANKGKNGN
jgi:hypothetical protein